MTEYSVLRPFAIGKASDFDWRIFSADGLQIGGSFIDPGDACDTAQALGLLAPLTPPLQANRQNLPSKSLDTAEDSRA